MDAFYGRSKEKIKSLEDELSALRRDFELRVKSYDANSHGWQEEIARLKAQHDALLAACEVALAWMQTDIFRAAAGLRRAIAIANKKEEHIKG